MVEYLSGGRIQGSSTSLKTTTFTSDFTSTSGWTSTNSAFVVNTSENAIIANNDNVTTNLQIAHDLGSGNELSDTAWVIDLDVKITAYTANSGLWTHIGMYDCDTTVLDSTNKDFLGMILYGESATNAIVLVEADSQLEGTLAPTTTSIAITGTPQLYLRMKRTASNKLTIESYSTSARTGTPSTTTTRTFSGNPQNLRYFKITNRDGGGGGELDIKIENIKIWDNITDPTLNEMDNITNVPVGTRYEETDTRKIYRMTEKATSSQSTGSTGAWEYLMNTGQTNWSVDFMGQKFEADHELIGQTINSISFDLSKNGSVADVLKLAKANSSNTITVLESIPISSVSSSGSGSGNTANFTTMTFDSFTPFVLQADDKLGIYASGTLGGSSSDSGCSGACTYVEIAHTSSSASANETRYGIANDGTNFTTGNHNDDIKYSIGVSQSMKIWKERGTAV